MDDGASGGGGGSPAGERITAWPWLLAAVGTGVEAAGLLVLAAMSAYGVVSGGASTTTRALTEAIVLVVLAGGVGMLARNLLARKSLAKTPTLLWNFMLFPVGYSLLTGGAPVWGGVTLALAGAAFVATLFVPRYDLDEGDDAVL